MKNGIDKQLLYDSVHLYNVLPLTSTCNVGCLFCSHRQNPPGIRTCVLPPLSPEELEELYLFLSPRKKIVIGESATRIVEGEPFTHPKCLEVLASIRRRFHSTPLQITTNGSYLTCKVVERLKDLNPLEINLSLNSASPRIRELLMRDKRADTAIAAARLLYNNGVVFHGSMVAVPWITGWEDIRNTLDYLAAAGAQTIRAFIPGLTGFPQGMQLPQENEWEEKLRDFLLDWKCRNTVPLTIEPPALQDLQAVIAGVIPQSKAALAGLKPGMSILSVNGTAPFSRVDAYNMLCASGSFNIKTSTNGFEKMIKLTLQEGEKSGLVMDYDLPWQIIQEIEKAISQKRVQNPVVLASIGGFPLLREVVRKSKSGIADENIYVVNNSFFGGTICAAGLLVVSDFRDAIKSLLKHKKPDLFILPALAFDSRGFDLLGESYQTLIDSFAIDVQLI